MKLSDCGARLISQFEGYSSKAYWDSLGNVWTIGFGTTGPHAYDGATCTPEQALAWLRDEADGKDGPFIAAMGLPLDQTKYDSLVSFAYNLGPHIFDKGRDIRTALDGDWSTVPSAMKEYDKAGTPPRPVEGLTRRRAIEARLWSTGSYGFPCTPTRRRREDDEP